MSYGVALSRAFAELDQIKLLGRHGRTDLTADGLLADPSLYAPTREQLLGNADASSATGEAQQAPTQATEQQRFDGRPPLPEGAQWLADTPQASDPIDATDKRQDAAPATASGFRQQLLAMADTTAPLRGDP